MIERDYTTYTCEICGYQDIDSDAVQKCENSHTEPDETAPISSTDYTYRKKSKYPTYIKIKFKDDAIKSYSLL